MKNRFIIIASLFLSTSSLADETQKSNPESSVVSIWNKHCTKCHGSDGYPTKIGKRLGIDSNIFDYPENQKSDLAQLFNVINEGSGKMPGFSKKLSNDDIKSIVEFIEYSRLIFKIKDREKQIDAVLEKIGEDYNNLPECTSITN